MWFLIRIWKSEIRYWNINNWDLSIKYPSPFKNYVNLGTLFDFLMLIMVICYIGMIKSANPEGYCRDHTLYLLTLWRHRECPLNIKVINTEDSVTRVFKINCCVSFKNWEFIKYVIDSFKVASLDKSTS